jgi:hypothetical protein
MFDERRGSATGLVIHLVSIVALRGARGEVASDFFYAAVDVEDGLRVGLLAGSTMMNLGRCSHQRTPPRACNYAGSFPFVPQPKIQTERPQIDPRPSW